MKLYPDAFNEYVARSGRVRTEASKTSMGYVVRRLQFDHPNLGAGRFTTQHLVEFCLSRDPAPKTIRHRRSILKGLFTWLKAQGMIPSNPASELDYLITTGRYEVRPGHWYDADVAARVIRACPDDLIGRRDRLALMFGFMLGLRSSSISRLRWDQFAPDFSHADLIVKGNKPTRKGVPAQIRSELSDWALERPESAVAVLPAFRCQGVLQKRYEPLWGAPLGKQGIYNLVQRAGERCGIELSPHDMRRTYAGILEEKGVPVQDIQRALDHSNVGTTSIYLDKNPAKSQAITGGFTLEL